MKHEIKVHNYKFKSVNYPKENAIYTCRADLASKFDLCTMLKSSWDLDYVHLQVFHRSSMNGLIFLLNKICHGKKHSEAKKKKRSQIFKYRFPLIEIHDFKFIKIVIGANSIRLALTCSAFKTTDCDIDK